MRTISSFHETVNSPNDPSIIPRRPRKSYPLVSVFVLTYNQEQYISETLSGLFAQDYENLEIVISDDNSTDATWEIVRDRVKEYRQSQGTHKIVLNKNRPNLGIVKNVEKALSLSHGVLFVANGGDDVSLPNRVSRIVEAWEADGRRAYAILHGFRMIGPCGNPCGEKLLFNVSPTTPVGAAMAYRREVFESFSPIEFTAATEDHIFVRRALLLGGTLTISDQLLLYRRGVGVSSATNYRTRRISISRACLASAMQTLRDMGSGVISKNVDEVRKIVVFLLNYYSREFFSYGEGIPFAQRWWIFKTLNKWDPLPWCSAHFLMKRMTCIYPRFINVYGRMVTHLFRVRRKNTAGVKKPTFCSREYFTKLKSVWKAWIKKNIIPIVDKLWLLIYRRRCVCSLAVLRKRVAAGYGPVRVAFLQLFPASNQNFSIFSKMMEDKNFDPYFIVYPDHLRFRAFSEENYAKTLAAVTKLFGRDRVLPGLDAQGKPIDYTDRFDLMTTSNPYEQMAHKEFKVAYWTEKGIPSFYMSYFYLGKCYVTAWNFGLKSLSCFQRVYIENESALEIARTHQLVHGKNCLLVGSPKLDRYASTKPVVRSRKRIILAPHHAIENTPTSSGAFLEYANDIPSLVREFPEIDFVFRPHPLMWQKLRGVQKITGLARPWGEKKVNDYIAALSKEPNVIMSDGGDYIREFADSDALIHDCGSFTAEYLYTGKPCAYVWRKSISIPKIFTDFGVKCLNAHYMTFSSADIRNFIRQVVMAGDDPKRTFRIAFAKREISKNYPNAGKVIYADIKEMVGMTT